MDNPTTKANMQPNVGLLKGLEIALKGTLIGSWSENQLRINLVFWQGWLVAIHCRYIDEQWTFSSLTYHLPGTHYRNKLRRRLTPEQFRRLTTLLQTTGRN